MCSNTRAGLRHNLAFSNINADICELIDWNKNSGSQHKEIYKGWCDVISNVRFEVKNISFCYLLILINAYQMIRIRTDLLFLTGTYINLTYRFTSLHGCSSWWYIISKGSILWILFVCKLISVLFQPQLAVDSLDFQPKSCFWGAKLA